MSIFNVKVDAWRGTSHAAAKRTRMEFLVEADDIDSAEAPAMRAASLYTAGHKVRAVEFVSASGPKVGPFCINKKAMKS